MHKKGWMARACCLAQKEKNENQNQKFHVPHNHNHVTSDCFFNQKLIILIMMHCGKNSKRPGGVGILPALYKNQQIMLIADKGRNRSRSM